MIKGTVPCFVEVYAKDEEEAWDTFHENLNELTVKSFYGHKGIGHPRKDFVEKDIEEVAGEAGVGGRGGGGGGGGGGTFFLLYNGTVSVALTPTVTGGAAGIGGTQAGSGRNERI